MTEAALAATSGPSAINVTFLLLFPDQPPSLIKPILGMRTSLGGETTEQEVTARSSSRLFLL